MKSLNRSLTTFAVLLAIIAALGVRAQPFWFDEFLHFAIGGYDSTANAWHVITRSIEGLNHGQTGIYMLLDFWLLKIFGANVWALRLPSILSTLWLLFVGKKAIEFLGFSYRWQILVMLALLCQTGLMTHAYEARPYMPLAASSLGVLAYYLSPIADRAKWDVNLLAWISILLGTLIHPYFIVYWASMYSFAYLYQVGTKKIKLSIWSALQFTPIALSALGLILFYTVATLTWKRGFVDFASGLSLDPFQFFNAKQSLKIILLGTHLEMLSGLAWLLIPLSLGYLGLQAFNVVSKKPVLQRYLSGLQWPLLLIALGIAISLLLSYISYARGYWVISRQWVASVAIVSIAFVWLIAQLSEAFSKRSQNIIYLVTVLILAVSLLTRPAPAGPSSESVNSTSMNGIEQCGTKEFGCWVQFAKINIALGGAVDPRFTRFYEEQSNCWQTTGSIRCFVEDKYLKVQ